MGTLKRNRPVMVIADYDSSADVLYIGPRHWDSSEGDGLPDGVELDYALADGKPCGATIIGYRRNGWPDRLEELARIVAGHLSVGADRVAKAIKSAVA
jgi:hypothetical protein